MATDAPDTAARSPANRARISNGTCRFAFADGRSAGARLLRDRELEFAEPLGGLALLTPIERARVQTAAALSARLEAVRSGLARGDCDMSDEDMTRLGNALSRALASLERLAAAKRKADAPTGPDALRSYLAERAEAVP